MHSRLLFLTALVPLTVLALPRSLPKASPATGTAAKYSQCRFLITVLTVRHMKLTSIDPGGGIGYNWGPTRCEAPYTCQVLNPWYSQCLKPVGSVSKASSSPSSGTVAAWDQCGGPGWTGPTRCDPATGMECRQEIDNPASKCACPGGLRWDGHKCGAVGGDGSGGTTGGASKAPPQHQAPAKSVAATPSGGGTSASFTHYSNCGVNACMVGLTGGGFTAAIDQKAFGVAAGQGAGPACGVCYSVTMDADYLGVPIANPKSVKVRINNLCPAIDPNMEWCAMDAGGKNTHGKDLHFDLCEFAASGVDALLRRGDLC